MKEILLCITAVLGKVFLCERLQPRRLQFSSPRKIRFLQNALDPDIDRERPQTFVSEKHHTISNLRAHARQLAKAFVKIEIGKRRPSVQINLAARDQARRIEQVLSPITE